MDRRNYLRGIAAAGSLFAGCSALNGEQTTEQTVERATEPAQVQGGSASVVGPGSDYETVIDLVERGADPTGNEPIDDLLASSVGPDTKIVLPDGQYKLGSLAVTGVDNLAIVGANATLLPAVEGRNILLSFQRVSDLLVEGITVDQSAPNRSGWIDVRPVGGRNVIRYVRLKGFNDVEKRTNGFTLLCEGRDTELVLDHVDMSEGARNGAGIYIFPQKAYFDSTREPGTIVIRETVMKNWGKEGLYGSPHGGPLWILGGRYENNAVVQIRIGGGSAATTALVRGVSVAVDDPPAYVARGRSGNMRGIWLEEGDLATVTSSIVSILDVGAGHSQGGIVVSEQFGRATIRDTTIRTDENVPAMQIESPVEQFQVESTPSLNRLPESWQVVCQDLRVRGASASGPAIRLLDRDNCVFDSVSLTQEHGSRHGLVSVNATGTDIVGGQWSTTGYPFLIGGAPTIPPEECLVRFERVELPSDGAAGSQELGQSEDGNETTSCVRASLLDGGTVQGTVPFVGVTSLDRDGPRGRFLKGKADATELTPRHR